MADSNGTGSIKTELARGVAKGGWQSILLGFVLYWLFQTFGAQMENMENTLNEISTLMKENNQLHRIEMRKASSFEESKAPIISP